MDTEEAELDNNGLTEYLSSVGLSDPMSPYLLRLRRVAEGFGVLGFVK